MSLGSCLHNRIRLCPLLSHPVVANRCGILKNSPSPASPFCHYTASLKPSCKRKRRPVDPRQSQGASAEGITDCSVRSKKLIRLITPYSAVALEIRTNSTNIDKLKSCVVIGVGFKSGKGPMLSSTSSRIPPSSPFGWQGYLVLLQRVRWAGYALVQCPMAGYFLPHIRCDFFFGLPDGRASDTCSGVSNYPCVQHAAKEVWGVDDLHNGQF